MRSLWARFSVGWLKVFSAFVVSVCFFLVLPWAVQAYTARSGDAYHQRIRTELENFTTWLSDNNARGYIGELGWPGNKSDPEQTQWNLLAEDWFKDADAAQLWVTPFLASRGEGPSEQMGIYVNSTGDPNNGSIDTNQAQHQVLADHPETVDYRRGVNFYGTTFGVNSDGSTDENIAVYPSQADLDYLSSQGVKTIRFSVAWERIQRSLFGTLDAGELTKVNNVITAAANAQPNPINVILLLGDNAHYRYTPDGVTPRVTYKMKTTGGNLNVEHFKDIWGKFSDLYKNNNTVVAYDLMNEPYGLDAESTSFTGSILFDWDDTTTQGWNGGGATFTNDTTTYYGASGGSLKVVKTGLTPSSYNNLFFGSPGGVSGSGNGFSCQIMLDPAQTGGWQALVGWQTGAPSYSVDYGNNFTLVPGEWVTVSHQFADTTNLNSMVIQVETTDGNSPDTLTLYVDNCGRGDVTSLTPAEVWETLSQDMVTFLRTDKDDHKTIIVPGYNYSSIYDWTTTHPDGWITDPDNNFLYEGHHYWDRNSSSVYTHTYDEENTDAEGRSYSTVGGNAPTGSVSLNGGASSTTSTDVTATLAVSDDVDSSNLIQYQLSEDSGFSGASWTDFASSVPLTLADGLGTKTVYVRYRDNGGFVSSTFNDTIELTAVTPPSENHSSDSNGSSESHSSNSSSAQPVRCDRSILAQPYLFQLKPSANQTQLYFSPLTDASQYQVMYGLTESADTYAATFQANDNSGVQTVVIHDLPPGKIYFRVRAMNQCQPGEWSNVLSSNSGNQAQLVIFANQKVRTFNNGQTCQAYKVQAGDNLWTIAEKVLGMGKAYTTLVLLNVEKYTGLHSSSLILPGWKLAYDCQ